MTSPALVARPRLPVDHLESPNYNSINSRCGEFLNTGLGGEGEELCLTEGALERFRSRIKPGNSLPDLTHCQAESKRQVL